MPTSFASYDLDQNGTISPEEWSQFYSMDEGPASHMGSASMNMTPEDPRWAEYIQGAQGYTDAAQPTEAFNLDDFIAKVSSGNFTDDDMLAFSNWYMGQQMGQQAGQLQYQNDYLEYLDKVRGLNEMQLAQAQQEVEFQQGEYWNWYVNNYFPHQQERDRMEYDLAVYNLDTQKALGQIEQGKAKDYAQAQFYNTEQAKYGADAARWQYEQMLQTPRQTQGARSLGGY